MPSLFINGFVAACAKRLAQMEEEAVQAAARKVDAEIARAHKVAQRTIRNRRKGGWTEEQIAAGQRRFVGEPGGMVYFIEALGLDLVKIGYTEGSGKRVASVAQGCPVNCRLLRTIKGGFAVEKLLHRRFAEHRSRGEWFRLTPIREAIAALTAADVDTQGLGTCIDCGCVRKQANRARGGHRCRSCGQKKWRRDQSRPKLPTKVRLCMACQEVALKATNVKGICASCAARAVWGNPETSARIRAARSKRRKACAHCGRREPRLGRSAKYHADCWATRQALTSGQREGLGDDRPMTVGRV